MSKILLGIRDDVIVFMSTEISKKEMRDAINAGCEHIVQTELTDELRKFWGESAKTTVVVKKAEGG